MSEWSCVPLIRVGNGSSSFRRAPETPLELARSPSLSDGRIERGSDHEYTPALSPRRNRGPMGDSSGGVED
jgi:hypothetical protein